MGCVFRQQIEDKILPPSYKRSSKSNTLSLYEALHVLQPPDVLLLLLHVNVIRYEDSQGSVDTSLIQVSLQKHLQVLVEVAEWWADVQILSLMYLVGGLGVCVCSIGIVVYVVDDDHAILYDGLDGQSTLVGFLNDDVQACWERWVLLLLAFCALLALLFGGLALVGFVAHGWVLVVCFWVEGVEVCDGEGDSDPRITLARNFYPSGADVHTSHHRMFL